MVRSSQESPGRRTAEKTSLFGLVSFQPRLAIVLIFLTLTIVVVGVRISRDSGIRRVDDLVRQAQRAFAVPHREGAARDPAEGEARGKERAGGGGSPGPGGGGGGGKGGEGGRDHPPAG